jgi:hypothetical protein
MVGYSLAAEDARSFLTTEPNVAVPISYPDRFDELVPLDYPPDAIAMLNESSSGNASALVLRNTSVIVLAPRAFVDTPVAVDESPSAVRQLFVYLNDFLFTEPSDAAAAGGNLSLPAPLRDGVRADVQLSASLEDVWRQALGEPNAPVRVYFGLPSGVVRVMPGQPMPFGVRTPWYDPLTEQWYQQVRRDVCGRVSYF